MGGAMGTWLCLACPTTHEFENDALWEKGRDGQLTAEQSHDKDGS